MPDFIINIRGESGDALRQANRLLDVYDRIDRRVQAMGNSTAASAQQGAAAQSRAARQASDAQAREAQRAADNAERWVAREYRDRVKYEQQKQREIQRTTDRASRDAQKMADDQAREAKRAADAQGREAQRQADNAERWQAREYRDRVRFEQQRQREAQRTTDRAAREAERRAEAEKRAFEESTSGAEMFQNAVTGLAGAFASMISVDAVLGEIGDSFDRVQRTIVESAKFVNDYREALLELAALKGRMGGTGEEVVENLRFRAQTLQTADAAAEFQLAALGSGEAAIDKGGVEKFISRTEFDKLMVLAGSMQAVEKGDAETYGALAGQVPTLMGKHVTGEEAFAKMSQFYKILQPGGSTFSSGVGQFLKNAPYSQLFNDPAEMMAVQSAFSVQNREGAGEQVQQFLRATVGGLGRMRGVQVEGDSQKVGQYLGGLGATDQMSPVQIGKLIAQDFRNQQASAATQGKKFNAMQYLLHQGYGNQEDRLSLMAFAELINSGTYSKTFEPLAQTMPSVDEAMAPIRRFQGADPAALMRRAGLSEELAKTGIGAGPNEYMQAIQRQAFARMQGRGDISGTYEETMQAPFWDIFAAGRQRDVSSEAMSMLTEEATRVGVSPGEGQMALAGTPDQMAQQYYDLATKIGQAGGNILPGSEELMKKMEQVMESTNRMTEAIADAQERARGGGQKAVPPAVPPPRKPPNWKDRP